MPLGDIRQCPIALRPLWLRRSGLGFLRALAAGDEGWPRRPLCSVAGTGLPAAGPQSWRGLAPVRSVESGSGVSALTSVATLRWTGPRFARPDIDDVAVAFLREGVLTPPTMASDIDQKRS